MEAFQEDQERKEVIGWSWLVGKLGDKAIRKLDGKYRRKAILSILIFAVALCATLFGVCELWVH